MPATRSFDPVRRNQLGRRQSQPKRDPGAYIGRLPERTTETLPDQVDAQDEGIAAVATQPGPVRGQAPAELVGAVPEGHREATLDRDEARRTAGENR